MKDSLTIIVSNMVGAAITVFYLSVMWRLHSNQAVLVVPYMLTMGVVTGLLGYIQYGVEDYDVALYRLGMIGSSMGIVMFASPLLAVVSNQRPSAAAAPCALRACACTRGRLRVGGFLPAAAAHLCHASS